MSKEICAISGEILQVSDLLLGMDFRSVHPIFKAKKSLILHDTTVFNFHRAKSWREKKLWYLALLNSFELIEWKTAANPAPHTIEFSFESAYTLACWIDYARHGIRDKIAFPRYVCDRDTQELANVPVWLDEINEIRKLFLQKHKEDTAKLNLNTRAVEIEREFRKASITGLAFTRELAKFALEASGCHESLIPQYLEILTTPLEDAWIIGFNKEDGKHLTQEIYEFFEEELPIHNQSFLSVRVQARKLMEAANRGYRTQGKDPSAQKKKETDDEWEYKIIQDIPQVEIGPEPIRSSFVKHWEYLAAHAKWEYSKIQATPKSGGTYGQF